MTGHCDVALRASFSRFDRIYETVEPYLKSERSLLAKLRLLNSRTMADGHGDQPARATSLAVAASASGYIDRASDVDYFRLEVPQRTEVQIFTTGSLDTIGSLRTASDRVVRDDDDSGKSLNFLIEATLERGTSYVRVGAFNGKKGAYVLHVERTGRVARSGHTYEPLTGWLVSPGRVEFRLHGASASLQGGCSNWHLTVNNSYDFHASKWQWRSGPGKRWADIPGTAQTGRRICPYSPSQSGEYRMVGEISISGERGKYASENIIRRP